MNDDRDGGVGDRTWSSIGRADPSGDCQLTDSIETSTDNLTLHRGHRDDQCGSSSCPEPARTEPSGLSCGSGPGEGRPGSSGSGQGGPGPSGPDQGGPGSLRSVEGGPGSSSSDQGGPGSLRSVEGGPGSSGSDQGGPGPLRSVEGGPGSSGGCSLRSVEGCPGSSRLRRRLPRLRRPRRRLPRLPTLRRRLPRLLRRLLPMLRRRLPRLPTLRRRLPRLLRRLLPTLRRRLPRLLRRRSLCAVEDCPGSSGSGQDCPGSSGSGQDCPGSLGSGQGRPGSSGSGQGCSGSSGGCSLCSGQGRSPILSKSFSTSRAWSFALSRETKLNSFSRPIRRRRVPFRDTSPLRLPPSGRHFYCPGGCWWHQRSYPARSCSVDFNMGPVTGINP